MTGKKLVRVIGARPQIMQVKPLQLALKNAGFEVDLLHTGQHYSASLSDDFFKILDIEPPRFNLEVGSGPHGKMTGRILDKFEEFLLANRYDGVVVDGDTNSTLGGALAAVKLGIPVFHVEAGTRDLDRRRPEEINRIATDHIASLNFAPIRSAMENLKKEALAGVSFLTGDVLLDNFLMFESKIQAQSYIKQPYNLLTLHRPENTDLANFSRFASVVRFLNAQDRPTIFPVHPRSKPVLDKLKAVEKLENIITVPPQDYFHFLGLIRDASLVLTDSGGVPRESAWQGKRCIMVFKKMTWIDLVEAGLLEILLSEKQDLTAELGALYNSTTSSQPNKSQAREIFGNGKASSEIAKHISNFFSLEVRHGNTSRPV